jgi:hypothetical protein
MMNLYTYILSLDDPFEYVYEGISGTHGIEIQEQLTEMYSEASIDTGLHPDDDFETIILRMLDNMDEDYG